MIAVSSGEKRQKPFEKLKLNIIQPRRHQLPQQGADAFFRERTEK